MPLRLACVPVIPHLGVKRSHSEIEPMPAIDPTRPKLHSPATTTGSNRGLELKPRKRTLFVLRPPSFERQIKPNDDHNRVDHVDSDCRGILKALLRLRDEHPEET